MGVWEGAWDGRKDGALSHLEENSDHTDGLVDEAHALELLQVELSERLKHLAKGLVDEVGLLCIYARMSVVEHGRRRGEDWMRTHATTHFPASHEDLALGGQL